MNNPPADRILAPIFLWFLMAINGFVMFEPAPFDLIGICLTLLFFLFLGLKVPKELTAPMLIWAVYILFTFISDILSAEIMLSLKPTAIRCFLIIISLFIACLIYENPQRYLPVAFQGYATATVITAVIGILAYYRVMPGSDSFLIYGRVKSTFKDVNVFTPFLIPVIVFYISRLESGESKKFVIPIAIIGILSVALLLGFSRGAWVNLALALITYMAIRLYTIKYTYELKRLAIFGALGLIAAIPLFGWLISSSAVNDLFQTRAQLVQSYDSADRFVSQRIALGIVLEYPFGVGLGQFRVSPYVDVLPHNVYLYIFAEGGWVPGASYIAFVLLTIWKGFKFCLIRSDIQLTALVIFSCIVSTQLQSFLIDSTHWRHLYILYGLMWGVMLHKPSLHVGYNTG